MMFKKMLSISVGLLCMFIVTVTFAGYPEIPRISIDELKQLIDTKADIIILDAQLKEI